MVLGAMVLGAMVALLVAMFMRDHPSDIGLNAYGEPEGAIQEPLQSSSSLNRISPFRILAQASRSRVFWALTGSFFICGLSANGLVQTHFISPCGDNGMSAVPAASVLAMMGAFDLVGTTVSGFLSDRYDNRKLLFWYYALRGLSLFWLPFSTFTFYGPLLFALFYGLDCIATVPPTVKLTAQAFGKEPGGLIGAGASCMIAAPLVMSIRRRVPPAA